MLFLFGGPTGRNDGVEVFCEQLGAEAEIVDWCNHEVHDLISDAFYYDLLGRVEQGEFGIWMPPSSLHPAKRSLWPGNCFRAKLTAPGP